ncbi:hypothetical protein Leryth_010638, partial [Lithospermum erythrorhizon]
MPMADPELWSQIGRVGPLPPIVKDKKAGRPRRLRRVNPIEADANGRTGQCNIRKYLCSICNEPGHNSRACKRKRDSNEAVMGEEFGDHGPISQDNIATSQVDQWPSQNSFASDSPPIRPMPAMSTFTPRNTRGVMIRAPPPMVGASMQNMAPFRSPGRAIPVFLNEGQKFINLKDLQPLNRCSLLVYIDVCPLFFFFANN